MANRPIETQVTSAPARLLIERMKSPSPKIWPGLAGYRVARGLAGWAFPSPHIVDGSILMWIGKRIMRVNTWLRRFESVLI
jgi:hypothetical protein